MLRSENIPFLAYSMAKDPLITIVNLKHGAISWKTLQVADWEYSKFVQIHHWEKSDLIFRPVVYDLKDFKINNPATN